METTARDRLIPAVLVLLMFSGFIKASPAMAWLPVDLTVVAVAVLAVMTAGVLLTEPSRANVPVLALALALALPLLLAPTVDGGDQKAGLLFGITLSGAFAAAVLLHGRPERAWWFVIWTALGALGVAALLQVAPSTEELYGRLALEGSNTIAVGRASGAGIVALWVLVRAKRLRARYGLPLVVVLVGALVGSGSRGPLFAVAVAVLAVALLRPGPQKVRELLVVGIGGTALAVWAFTSANVTATQRILLLFSSDRGASVNTRADLFERSADLALSNPLGLGWGGLATHLYPLEYPHNIVLEVFGEAGWVPGLAFVAVVVIALRRAFRGGDLGAAVGGLLLFWIANAMVSGDVNDNRTLFVTMAVALVIPAANRSSSVGQLPVATQARMTPPPRATS